MIFLDTYGIDNKDLSQALTLMLENNISFADIYFQHKTTESWYLEDAVVSGAGFHINSGFGARAVKDDKTGFCFSNNIDRKELFKACKTACSALNGSKKIQQIKLPTQANIAAGLYPQTNIITNYNNNAKASILKFAHQYAVKNCSEAVKVNAGLSASFDKVLITTSEGELLYDERPLIRFNITITASKDNRTEVATAGGGGRFGYEKLDENFIKQHIDSAIEKVRLKLISKPAPAGELPLVLAAGWPGIILHEAIGHGLEADSNRKNSSCFANKINTKIANDICNIIDDGTLEHRRGSLHFDDEGTKTQSNLLVENGILKNYMQDKLNARLMGTALSGNARRESYAHIPLPRMTNTFLQPQEDVPEDIIKSVKKGIYAVDFSGGQVDTSSGKFVFDASLAFMIENGKVTFPLKGASIIGDGQGVLEKISMIGHDLQFDAGIGTCGKQGQSIPVGVGMPTIKVDNITIGGTA